MFLKKIFFLEVILITMVSCYSLDSREAFSDLKKLEGKWSSKKAYYSMNIGKLKTTAKCLVWASV